jgi:hypothetical protein
MEEQNCIFGEIELTRQDIPDKMFSELLYNTYNNICFSTFPYLVYKKRDSMNAIYNYNSGNCIAIAYYMKMYLKKNVNLNSYVIGASVPQSYRVKGCPHMCHCALLIPKSEYEFYIIDGALYFLEPLYCNLNEMGYKRTFKKSDIYNYNIIECNYVLEECDTLYLDNNYDQKLLENSLKVKCTFNDDENECWNYYINEIKNPDHNIGISFLKHKPEPFILYTIYEGGLVKLKYKVGYYDGNLSIKKYPEKKEISQGEDNEKERVNTLIELQRFIDFV